MGVHIWESIYGSPYYGLPYEPYRYIWCLRMRLARTLHDMLQQQHCSKKYMNDAWLPLHNWVHAPKSSKGHQARVDLLTTFDKKDKKFHTVVTKCL